MERNPYVRIENILLYHCAVYNYILSLFSLITVDIKENKAKLETRAKGFQDKGDDGDDDDWEDVLDDVGQGQVEEEEEEEEEEYEDDDDYYDYDYDSQEEEEQNDARLRYALQGKNE